MNEIQKALSKLPKKYRSIFELLMLRLLARDFLGLNIAKLKGRKNLFRLKHGKLRIIFRMDKEQMLILQVGMRSEKTYRNF